MQADIRLRQTPNPGVCPLCNTPLATTSVSSSFQPTHVMCPSCGYSAPFIQRQHTSPSTAPTQHPTASSKSSVWIDPAVSPFLVAGSKEPGTYPPGIPGIPQSHYTPKKKQSNPVTPIPPRASAQQPPHNVRVRPKYARTLIQSTQEDSDITRFPTLPPPSMWQYETPDFQIESSLSSLSLIVDAPTHPEPLLSPRSTDRLPDIYEIDTIPPKQVAAHHTDIDQIDTLPPIAGVRVHAPANQNPGLALIPAASLLPTASTGMLEQRRSKLHEEITDPSSWTAGSATGSPYAQLIADPAKSRRQKPSFNPLDHLRWWLLRPGRIEFMFWLGGTILLVSVTFVLLLVTAMSFAWFTPVLPNGLVSPLNGSDNNQTSISTVITTPGLNLALIDKGPLVPGQPLHLRGTGFTPHGVIEFTDERKQPLLNQDNQSDRVQADEQGTFAVTLKDSSWTVGPHLIIAREAATGHLADLLITLASGPFGQNATATLTTPQLGITATSTSINGPVNYPTAVNSTPPPPKPTVAITPTPFPSPTQQPSPTPTPGITPTATPGTTPTATVGITPTLSPTVNSSSNNFVVPSTAASVGGSDPLSPGVQSVAPWFWLLILGYSLSMLMLGMVGVIRKRHR